MTGLNRLRHGDEVAVAQCSASPGRNRDSQLPAVSDEAISLPPCMHGMWSVPLSRRYEGHRSPPWSRRTSASPPSVSTPDASPVVRGWRIRHADTLVRTRSEYRAAKSGIVRPLEIERTPSTTSTAHSAPAVSTTQAPVASATMKLLW